jgi:hypothetical protein
MTGVIPALKPSAPGKAANSKNIRRNKNLFAVFLPKPMRQ